MSKNKNLDYYKTNNCNIKYDSTFNQNIVHQNDNSKINEQLFIDTKCTSKYLGIEPIKQECYTCSICNPSKTQKICKYCYLNCHSKCREMYKEDTENEDEKKDNTSIEFEEFACYCGIRLKHIPDKPPKKERVICAMNQIDEVFHPFAYYCQIHKKYICGMCAVECHKECWLANEINMNPEEDVSAIFSCDCKSNKHTKYNEIAFKFPIKDYEKLTQIRLWPVQIINVLFSNESNFTNFKNVFKNIFNNDNKEDIKKYKDIFFPLLEVFSNYFDRKFKTFYFDEKLLDTFKFVDIIKYLTEIEINEDDTDINPILIKFRLLYVLLFLHLKADFQDIKTLTSIDFLNNTILERFIYKRILMKPTIFTQDLNSKYNLINLFNEDNILKELAIKHILSLMNIGISKLSFENNLEEFCIGLKYLCFMLKRMVFTKNNIIYLITELHTFHNKLYEYLDADLSKRYYLMEVYWCLAEIFFLIATTYNDLILEEYFNGNNYNKKEDDIKTVDFIHVKSKHGITLFRMVVKTCDIFIEHYKLIQSFDESNIDKNDEEKINLIAKKYSEILTQLENQSVVNKIKIPSKKGENKGIMREKTITLLNETIKLFSLANNSYLDQVDSITSEDLISYQNYCNQIENNYFTTIPKDIGNDILEQLHNLKKSIEVLIFFYFNNNDEQNNKISEKIIEAISFFNERMYDIFSKCPSDNKTVSIKANSIKNMEDEKQKLKNDIKAPSNMTLELQQLDNNNIQEEKKIEASKYYKYYILSNVSETFKFTELHSFKNNINNFIDCLILSNIDEILFKLLMFISNRNHTNYVNEYLLDKIYPFFELFFLSKRGIKNFIFGKNVQRINKILNRFNEKEAMDKSGNGNKNIDEDLNKTRDNNIVIFDKTLDLLKDLLDGLELYNIDIKKHKVLARYKKNLLEHLENMNIFSDVKKYTHIFISHTSKIMEIFSKLAKNYESEDYSEIKRRITYILADSPSNIFNKEKFRSLFNIKDDDIDTSNIDIQLKDNNNNKLESNSNNIIDSNNEDGDSNNIIDSNNKDNNNNINSNNIIDSNNKIISNDSLIENNKEQIDPEITNLINLYFSYFNLMKENMFYIYNSSKDLNLLEKIYNINDLHFFNILLKKNLITLEQKTILLGYSRSLYLLDILDYYDIFQKEHCLTNYEYKQIVESNLEGNLQKNIIETKNNVLEIPEELYKKLSKKENNSININIVIKYYIKEIYKFPMQVNNESNAIENKEFFLELLNGIHYISNFIYFEKDIWAYIVLSFYEMTLELIKKADLFITVYNEIISEGYAKTSSITISEDIKKKIEQITNVSFNIYNKKKLYIIIIETINYIKTSLNLTVDNNLVKFLEEFDQMSEADFTPFSLVENLDYEYFYEEADDNDESESNNNKEVSLYNILQIFREDFIKAFIDINNTNFLNVFTTVPNDAILIDFRQTIINYFHAFINSIESNSKNKLIFFVSLVEKMLFYDGDEMQKRFEIFLTDKYVFDNLNRILNNHFVINFSLARNIFAKEQSLKICNLTKLIMQFIQNLGENFNKTFHDKIFKLNTKVIQSDDINNNVLEKDESSNDNSNEEETKFKISHNYNALPHVLIKEPIYGSIVKNLKRVIFSFDLNTFVNCELPYDSLIVTTTNAVDFLIEYIETVGSKKEIVKNYLNNLFFDSTYIGNNIYEEDDYNGIMSVLNIRINDNKEQQLNETYILRRKIICYVKMKIIQLLTSYFQTGNKYNEVKLFFSKKCSSVDLFNEILYNFKQLLIMYEKNEPKNFELLKKCNNKQSYVNVLIDLYTHETSFRNIIELTLILKIYVLIKTFEIMYKENSLYFHFEKLVNSNQNTKDDEPYSLDLSSDFSQKVYMFLERVVLKVEIKKDEKEEEEEEEEEDDNTNINNINNNIEKLEEYNNIKQNENNNDDEEEENIIEDDNNESDHINQKEELHNNINNNITNNNNYNYNNYNENDNKQYAFFIRPYLTFLLSEHTKNEFENGVDRTSATAKYVSLVSESDFFLFESVVNYNTIGKSKFLLMMANLNFNYFEILNYLIIAVQNILITNHFYLTPDLPPDRYDTVDPNIYKTKYDDNFYLCIVHTILLIVELVVFFYFKYPNAYQKKLMNYCDKRFVFKKDPNDKVPQVVVDYFQGRANSIMSVLSETNKGITLLNQIYIAVIPSVLTNRDINLFILTFILNVCYLISNRNMLFVPQVLFIINIIPTLFDIFMAMKLKFINMITVLLFTYLIGYLFMWFAFYYFADLFVFYDIKERESRASIQESFCYSSLQCILLYYIK